MSALTDLSISAASDLLRKHEVSARELTKTTLARIDATEHVVNAYVQVLDPRAPRRR